MNIVPLSIYLCIILDIVYAVDQTSCKDRTFCREVK